MGVPPEELARLALVSEGRGLAGFVGARREAPVSKHFSPEGGGAKGRISTRFRGPFFPAEANAPLDPPMFHTYGESGGG